MERIPKIKDSVKMKYKRNFSYILILFLFFALLIPQSRVYIWNNVKPSVFHDLFVSKSWWNERAREWNCPNLYSGNNKCKGYESVFECNDDASVFAKCIYRKFDKDICKSALKIALAKQCKEVTQFIDHKICNGVYNSEECEELYDLYYFNKEVLRLISNKEFMRRIRILSRECHSNVTASTKVIIRACYMSLKIKSFYKNYNLSFEKELETLCRLDQKELYPCLQLLNLKINRGESLKSLEHLARKVCGSIGYIEKENFNKHCSDIIQTYYNKEGVLLK